MKRGPKFEMEEKEMTEHGYAIEEMEAAAHRFRHWKPQCVRCARGNIWAGYALDYEEAKAYLRYVKTHMPSMVWAVPGGSLCDEHYKQVASPPGTALPHAWAIVRGRVGDLVDYYIPDQVHRVSGISGGLWVRKTAAGGLYCKSCDRHDNCEHSAEFHGAFNRLMNPTSELAAREQARIARIPYSIGSKEYKQELAEVRREVADLAYARLGYVQA